MPTQKAPRILFYVQHLLGVGHVFRATRVARGLAQNGCEVHIIWGGYKIDFIDLEGLIMHYLPGVRAADESFKQLIDEDGKEFGEDKKQKRCSLLLNLFDKIDPDIVLTEAYPFGRRQMRFELIPFLEHIKKSSKNIMVVASIRDIMQENKQEKKVQESCEKIKNFYHHVMVHGDENLIPIEETLQGIEEFREKIFYTGLVIPGVINENIKPSIEADVIVSVGGGAVGLNLLEKAIDAMQFSTKFPKNWCLITGPDLSKESYDKLVRITPDGMRVRRYISDLALVLKNAKVSVSRAGYNTTGDILRAQVHSVLVPFSGGKETEQLKRATILSQNNIVKMLLDEDLTSELLARAIDEASDLTPTKVSFDTDGARNSGIFLLEKFEKFQKSLK